MTRGSRTDGVRPARRRMERGERQEAILDAAARVFAAADAATVNVDLVAVEAGVSRALVYEYFGDRANLVNEVRRRFVREFAELLEAVAATSAPADLLRGLVDAHLRFAERGLGAYRFASEDAEPGIAWLARYFGGTPEAVLVATAADNALRSYVTRWAQRGDVDHDRAAALIVAFLDAGLRAVRPLGATSPPVARAVVLDQPA